MRRASVAAAVTVLAGAVAAGCAQSVSGTALARPDPPTGCRDLDVVVGGLLPDRRDVEEAIVSGPSIPLCRWSTEPGAPDALSVTVQVQPIGVATVEELAETSPNVIDDPRSDALGVVALDTFAVAVVTPNHRIVVFDSRGRGVDLDVAYAVAEYLAS
ncbi:hypothetical protein DW322_18945 [Rhodococcus rhodnii]|uniref:Lipoprotein n=2 Tax=Rhodococcus rhodnii TaxID=38312 RepID=R7WJW5_9NOCA|nr:hypothetical protein Rrhod_3058 [Rhodococcus rhodnii LMG 5362]TXG91879.1 hypothetical protein DW322_18945 [Rhodococcus rhodnii]